MKHIIFILFICLSIKAQTINIGFGFQTSFNKKFEINKSESIFETVPYPTEFHLAFEYVQNKIIGIEFRIGKVFEIQNNNINGFEFGLSGKYLITPSFYLTGHYIVHINYEGGGNNGSNEVTFGMPGIGIGFIPVKQFRFGLVFLKPNDVIIAGSSYDPNIQTELNWLIRFNAGFYFTL